MPSDIINDRETGLCGEGGLPLTQKERHAGRTLWLNVRQRKTNDLFMHFCSMLNKHGISLEQFNMCIY